MKIRVYLYTILKKYGKGKIDQDNMLYFSHPMSLQGLASFLNLPEKPGKTFLVNDRPRPGDYQLKDGDSVKIFGFIGGG
jgi:hypothetical protein